MGGGASSEGRGCCGLRSAKGDEPVGAPPGSALAEGAQSAQTASSHDPPRAWTPNVSAPAFVPGAATEAWSTSGAAPTTLNTEAAVFVPVPAVVAQPVVKTAATKPVAVRLAAQLGPQPAYGNASCEVLAACGAGSALAAKQDKVLEKGAGASGGQGTGVPSTWVVRSALLDHRLPASRRAPPEALRTLTTAPRG
mmetsp:Transcript_95571/g.242914  ORF Transcript_95571/g.242914 Transcript_95571/m.242914 type:complete len:195 (-) Transcript_95571:144-728(-)|eukprot:CAMPEP_0183392120 /NCGR_PEP_ID=MMETSP0370-20130417/6915_1 /TAXON_ID=268820 /ORGANISM="Peridinium aciculiferum, Strain PAER-2" /LENGTH=194 /DNA_ID=CAMNT_0025571975 /DNA_START=73 /DNA_END=657 /DNA_ORIENTATION=+